MRFLRNIPAAMTPEKAMLLNKDISIQELFDTLSKM